MTGKVTCGARTQGWAEAGLAERVTGSDGTVNRYYRAADEGARGSCADRVEK